MSRSNFVKEDLSFTRQHMQEFINEGKNSNKSKTKDEIKAFARGKGLTDFEADHILGDLDSYL